LIAVCQSHGSLPQWGWALVEGATESPGRRPFRTRIAGFATVDARSLGGGNDLAAAHFLAQALRVCRRYFNGKGSVVQGTARNG
jgi:hypothetical protein